MDKPSFEESLRELAARRLAAEAHPTPEDLAAYRSGELATEQYERIKDHVAICESCSKLLLDLAEFERFEPAQSISPADAQAEASWQRLRERLKEEGDETDVERLEDTRAGEPAPILAPHPSRHPIPLWRRPVIPWALAAGLALCVVGLGLRVGNLGREIVELSRIRIDPRVTLLPEEDGTRGENGTAPVHAGENVAYDLLLSSDPKTPTYSLYEVEIVPADGDGESILVGREPAHGEILSVNWPSPEPGDYVFQVSGIEGEKKTPVGHYPVTVLPAR